jgi:hypothetical protein
VIVAPLLKGAIQVILALTPEMVTTGAAMVDEAELAAIGKAVEYAPHPHWLSALTLKLYD